MTDTAKPLGQEESAAWQSAIDEAEPPSYRKRARWFDEEMARALSTIRSQEEQMAVLAYHVENLLAYIKGECPRSTWEDDHNLTGAEDALSNLPAAVRAQREEREKLNTTLELLRADFNDVNDERARWKARAEAAEKRVSELEALPKRTPGVDAVWDALRKRCCATKPHTDATRVVMVGRDDIAAALKATRAEVE